MDKYDVIETDQESIELENLIWTICHLQDDNKQYVMDTVKNNKQVYMFYQAPYQSNADYLEAFQAISKQENYTMEQWGIIQDQQLLHYKKNTISTETPQTRTIILRRK